MSDIFISYAREDLNRAQKLANALGKEGWSVFWDRTIPAGKTWRDVIGNALGEARCVIVAWSTKSIESTWVIEEADEGRERGILVPVFLDNVKPPIGFRNLQAENLIGWDGTETSPSFRKLVVDIGAILGPPVKTESGRVAPVETKEARTPVVEQESKPPPAPEPPSLKPPVEPPPPPGPRPWPKLLPWLIGAAILASVFVASWLFQEPEKIRQVEPPPTAPQKEDVAKKVPKAPVPEKKLPGVPNRTRPSGDMVVIPAGEFWMGCNEKVDRQCKGDEKPGGNVYLKAFAIDKHEVMVAEYRKCVEAGGCSSDVMTKSEWCNWQKSGREDHPINCVDWYDANAYCAWAGKRLPTEAEWEKAARGTDGRVYPWGNQWDWSRANVSREGVRRDGTDSVASYPLGVSPYELYDMAGSVREWTSSLHRGYPYKADDGREDPTAQGYRVTRGGSWESPAWYARASSRSPQPLHAWFTGNGFRCAKTP